MDIRIITNDTEKDANTTQNVGDGDSGKEETDKTDKHQDHQYFIKLHDCSPLVSSERYYETGVP